MTCIHANLARTDGASAPAAMFDIRALVSYLRDLSWNHHRCLGCPYIGLRTIFHGEMNRTPNRLDDAIRFCAATTLRLLFQCFNLVRFLTIELSFGYYHPLSPLISTSMHAGVIPMRQCWLQRNLYYMTPSLNNPAVAAPYSADPEEFPA